MRRTIVEKLKTLLIVALLVCLIIEIGVLLNIKDKGFLKSLFNNDTDIVYSEQLSESAQGYAYPFKISVFNGENVFSIERQDETFETHWKSIKSVLQKVLSENNGEIVTDNIYDEILNEKGMCFYYRNAIDTKIVLYDEENVDKYIKKIEFVLIILKDKVNAEIYVSDGEDIYKFITEYNGTTFVYNDLEKTITNTQISPFYSNKPYRFIYNNLEFFESRKVSILFDLNEMKLSELLFSVPELIEGTIDIYNLEKAERLKTILFGIYSKNYTVSQGENNEIQFTSSFTSSNEIYRIFSDGLMTYKKVEILEKEENELTKSYEQASKFIQKHKGIIGEGTNIYLVSVEEEAAAYRFIYNYIVEGVLVDFALDNPVSDGKEKNCALEIIANNESVIDARWILINMQKNYSFFNGQVSTEKMMEAFNEEKLIFKDISLGYVIDRLSDVGISKPVWVLDNFDKTVEYAEIQESENDGVE